LSPEHSHGRPVLASSILALTALVFVALAVVIAAAPAAASPGHALTALGKTKQSTSISATRSASSPHWACPEGACEAIVEPHVATDSGRTRAPGGRLYEGSGELGGFSPQDLESAYKIPLGSGSGQTVAVVDAYGYAKAEADLAQYRSRYDLPPCTKANGCFVKLNQRGKELEFPAEEAGWDVEQALDLDMVSAACPSCHIVLVEATSESPFPNDLAESVNTAVKAGANEVSNSYGLPEEGCGGKGGFECTRFAPDYSHPGVFISAAAGDHGYDNFYPPFDSESPLFPADLPTLTAVGGTSLSKAANPRGWSEQVWNEPSLEVGTGSGCSTVAAKPSWQRDKGCAGRMDNDVAAVAAVETPVSIYATAEGGWALVGGTSASSPLIAGIVAHESESVRSLGAQAFYEGVAPVFDVTEGNDGDVTGGKGGKCTPPAEDEYFCNAEIGYDGPTGMGAPDAGATPPTVTGVEPDEGTGAGGTVVTITGTHLGEASSVRFGETAAKRFEVDSATSITAESPAGAGTVDVTVTTAEGPSESSPADHFTYIPVGPLPVIKHLKPKRGPETGETPVTITGTNFSGAISVKFGDAPAPGFEVNPAGTTITVSSPAGTGLVNVTVTTLGGSTTISNKDRFRYQRPKRR
jgi:IPT/TIG domain